jgi:hypothetical protein
VTTRAVWSWIGAAIGLLSLSFVFVRLVHQMDQIPPIHWTYLALSHLAGAVIMSGLPIAMAAAAMSLLASVGGVSLPLRESFELVGQSQIGKYLPGNVFHYLGRIALGVRRGLPAGPLSLVVGAETALTIAVAVLVGTVGVLLDRSITEIGLAKWRAAMLWGAFGVATLVVVSLSLPVARRRVTKLLSANCTRYASRRTLLAAALYFLSFVSLGIAIELMVRGVLGANPHWGWLQFTWRFALIWVIGLLAIGAPAGLGVREALLLVWFSPVLGESTTLALAGLLRLVTMAADIIVFGLAWLLSRGRLGEVSTVPS